MKLASFSRYPFLFGPSPVHPLERLSAHLGAAQVWAKRDAVSYTHLTLPTNSRV